ncbi:hypothetical protein KP509_36G059200 [Ceratopteris richardii]|uniref:Pentatricopeptide repeat-containing protein n=1 Tax=Ceratopteris richardii TaxID=49495 RepID=A0A8T2QCD0_CERRI|nr:hypothetical protein KP509_36G059200 [Ceratopteris richardii]
MQVDSVPPNEITLIFCLKACGSIGDIEKAQEVHAEIERRGLLHESIALNNALVDIFSKCGWLATAEGLLYRISERNVISWTSLIAGYVEHGFGVEGLDCFWKMRHQCVLPNAAIYVCCLKACANIGAPDKAQELHVEMERRGLLDSNIAANTLLDVYMKCGCFSLAREVFDRFHCHDVISWTSLIVGYVEHGDSESALKCYQKMQVDSVPPNEITLIFCLKACGSIGDIEKAQEVHAEIERRGLLHESIALNNALVDIFSKCGWLATAEGLLYRISERNVISWTSLIAGYVEHGFGVEGLDCFWKMRHQCVLPDAAIYVCCLKACANIGAPDKAQELHVEMERGGLLDSNIAANTLLDVYMKCGCFSLAREVFDRFHCHDVISWTSLIVGYVEHGDSESALKCYQKMQVDSVPPNEITLIFCLKACGSIGDIEKAQEVHAEIERRGLLHESIALNNALVDIFSKCGWLATAEGLLYRISERNVISWTSLIAGYVEHGFGVEGLDCFWKMRHQCVLPDAAIYVCCLKACANIGAPDKAQELHVEMERRGLLDSNIAANTLLDVYMKCGCFSLAREVFDRFHCHDVISWTSLIVGYVEHGDSESALKCYQQMQKED